MKTCGVTMAGCVGTYLWTHHVQKHNQWRYPKAQSQMIETTSDSIPSVSAMVWACLLASGALLIREHRGEVLRNTGGENTYIHTCTLKYTNTHDQHKMRKQKTTTKPTWSSSSHMLVDDESLLSAPGNSDRKVFSAKGWIPASRLCNTKHKQ